MSNNTDPLFRHVLSISQALDSCRRAIQRGMDRPTPEKRDLARVFLYNDLYEAAALLGMIRKTIQALQETNARLLEHVESLRSRERHDIDGASEASSIMVRRMELGPELTVLTKALYEWLYHIQEDIESEPTLNVAIPGALRAQLDRYCVFRHKLVTHKKERKVFATGGIRSNIHDPSKTEILLVPIEHFPERAIKELDRLYEAARPYLDTAEASEENVYERMGILYRRLGQFTGDSDLQAKVKDFIDHYGTISDTPHELAAFLDEFTAAVAPHLGAKERS